MAKYILRIFTLLAALVLAACSNAAASNNPPAENKPGAAMLTVQGEDPLPVELQLALGTLSLEGSEYEVDAQTAAELLPLWKAVRSLSGSDTVAQGEIQALFKQIQETMTPEQIEAIADMHLTRESMSEIFEKLGLEFGAGGGRFENMSPEMQATMEAARESGQSPGRGGEGGGFVPGEGPGGGGFVPGGGGFGPGGEPGQADPELQATAQARRTQRAGTNAGIPAPVLDAVIEYLEGKSN